MNQKVYKLTVPKVIFWTIVGFIVVSIITLFLGLSTVWFDYLFAGILFVPDKLGLVKHVTPEDTILARSPLMEQEVNLLWAGRYTIYTTEKDPDPYTIQIIELATGEPIQTTPLFPPDGSTSRSTEELPTFEFYIERNGRYQITLVNSQLRANQEDFVKIEPDVKNYNGMVAFVAAPIQIILIVLVARFVSYQWRKKQLLAEAEEKRQKQEAFTGWLDKQKQK